MNDLDELLAEFPAESRDVIAGVWRTLPAGQQQNLLALLPVLPGDPDKLRKLFAAAREQMEMAFGDQHGVAIVGPANVGKSTLFNRLISKEERPAEVSPIPGTTRDNRAADAGPFTVMDTPGADAVGRVGERERELALQAAAGADFLLIIFDAIQGIKREEENLFAELQRLGKPYVVVLNKMDLVGKQEKAVVANAAANLGLAPENIIPVSALKDENLEQVVSAIVAAEPRLVAALGRGLPAYRWQLAWQLITRSASTASLVALTPLPFVDFIPLVALQVTLILGIARIYNYRLTPARAREVAGVLGGGFLARTLFYEVAKLGGPPTWLVAAAVAAGTTVAMGYGAILWFDRGERLSREAVGAVARTVSDHLVEGLKGLGRRRPSRKRLSERVREALQESPLATDAGSLETIARGPAEAE
jgi:small GTP-binding protein